MRLLASLQSRVFVNDVRREVNNAMDLMVPVMRPLLPTAEKVVPYLKRIDAVRYYSNHGPLLRDLEKRLASHFRILPRNLRLLLTEPSA